MLLFGATLVSVYLVYGYQWAGGDPLADAGTARQSALFAGGLMAILLAHELGHYVVARRHGFALSLPYFIPFPLAFGTMGAVIRLRTLPRNRTALLEMGAAGPLAGFLVTVVVMGVGLAFTDDAARPVMTLVDAAGAEPGWLDGVVAAHPAVAAALAAVERGLEAMGWVPEMRPQDVTIGVLANPPLMDLLGWAILGHPPGRYATLHPLAMAGWVGCLLTAINLLPVGQLDGGHILNGLVPRRARRVARLGLGLALLAGLAWPGWVVWAGLVWSLGAWRSLPVPESPPLTARARVVAGLAVVALAGTFMLRPFEVDAVSLDAVDWVDEAGRTLTPEQVRARLGMPATGSGPEVAGEADGG